MFKKVTVLVAAATGYVLGARAGRDRYDQIKAQAQKVRRDPRVQQAAQDTQDYVGQQAPVVKEKAADAARQAADATRSAAGSASDKAAEKAPGASHKADAVSDKASAGPTADDDLDGVDLVAANSDVPDPRDD